jgi:hypothetical protein
MPPAARRVRAPVAVALGVPDQELLAKRPPRAHHRRGVRAQTRGRRGAIRWQRRHQRRGLAFQRRARRRHILDREVEPHLGHGKDVPIGPKRIRPVDRGNDGGATDCRGKRRVTHVACQKRHVHGRVRCVRRKPNDAAPPRNAARKSRL